MNAHVRLFSDPPAPNVAARQAPISATLGTRHLPSMFRTNGREAARAEAAVHHEGLPRPFGRVRAMLGIRDQAHRRLLPLRLPCLALALLWAAAIPRTALSATDETLVESEASEESETEENYVSQIRFEGHDALSTGELRDYMLTQAPPWYRFWTRLPFYEDEVREDMKRLASLYRQHGYYEAKAEYSLLYSDEGPGVTIDIQIDEGKPIRLGELKIVLPDGSSPESHPLLDAKRWRKLVSKLPLEPDRIFRLGEYQLSRKAILAWVGEAGFARAQLEGNAEVDIPTHRARIEWTLVLGPRVRLGEIEIDGLDAVERRIVEREIRFEAGEWYSQATLAETRQRIQNLSLFRWTIVEALPDESTDRPSDPGESTPESGSDEVTVDADPDAITEVPESAEAQAAEIEGETWPVSIRVAERDPRRVRLGGGWGTDTSFRAELSWHHRNFFGGARHMDVGLRYSGLGASFQPSFTEPYLFGTRTKLLVSPAVIYETQDAYSARRILTDVQLQRDLIEHVQIRFGYQLDRSDVYSVLDNPGPDDLPEGISITTGPNIALLRSTVDNRLNATKGTWLEVEAESSVKAFASDEDFVRYTLDARGFFEVFDTVLALRALAGTIQNHGNTKEEDIPLIERFYSGGSNSNRGFAYRSLSPEDANGDSIGGSSLLEGSFEWRIPVWGPLGVVGFLDAAQVDPEPWQFRVDDLRYAAGTGLRYTTPAGPIRVDFAWRLNPPEHRGQFRISASLGHTF